MLCLIHSFVVSKPSSPGNVDTAFSTVLRDVFLNTSVCVFVYFKSWWGPKPGHQLMRNSCKCRDQIEVPVDSKGLERVRLAQRVQCSFIAVSPCRYRIMLLCAFRRHTSGILYYSNPCTHTVAAVWWMWSWSVHWLYQGLNWAGSHGAEQSFFIWQLTYRSWNLLSHVVSLRTNEALLSLLFFLLHTLHMNSVAIMLVERAPPPLKTQFKPCL